MTCRCKIRGQIQINLIFEIINFFFSQRYGQLLVQQTLRITAGLSFDFSCLRCHFSKSFAIFLANSVDMTRSRSFRTKRTLIYIYIHKCVEDTLFCIEWQKEVTQDTHYLHSRPLTHTYITLHTYIRTYIHTYIHTYIYIYIYTSGGTTVYWPSCMSKRYQMLLVASYHMCVLGSY